MSNYNRRINRKRAKAQGLPAGFFETNFQRRLVSKMKAFYSPINERINQSREEAARKSEAVVPHNFVEVTNG